MTGDFIFSLMAKWINTCLKIPLRSGTDMLNEECPQFSFVTQSCSTLCDAMDCSIPGLFVHHQLPESIQTHVH